MPRVNSSSEAIARSLSVGYLFRNGVYSRDAAIAVVRFSSSSAIRIW